MRRLRGHLSRGELPEGLRPKWERKKNGVPWVVDRFGLEIEEVG